MTNLFPATNQIHFVTNFQDLVSTSFHGEMNAICWTRELRGDFSEIANTIELNGNIATLDPDELLELQLSEQGTLLIFDKFRYRCFLKFKLLPVL